MGDTGSGHDCARREEKNDMKRVTGVERRNTAKDRKWPGGGGGGEHERTRADRGGKEGKGPS